MASKLKSGSVPLGIRPQWPIASAVVVAATDLAVAFTFAVALGVTPS